MSKILSSSEAVEIAINIEKNGRDFYSQLMTMSFNDKVKDLFEFLMREEIQHIVDFKQILASLKGYEPREAYPEEYFSYLESFAEGQVFAKENKGIELAKMITSEREALNKAIDLEKSSVIFYEGMKKILLGKDNSALDKIIAQEKGHMDKLIKIIK